MPRIKTHEKKGQFKNHTKQNEKRKTKSSKEHASYKDTREKEVIQEPHRVKNKASYKDTHETKGEAQYQIKCASNEHGHMTRSYALPLSLDGAGV